jgi:thiamine-phosphate pyrophosphorylase
MKPVVISPADHDTREPTVLGRLLETGLERYHVRKPGWTLEQLSRLLAPWPRAWRARVVLHHHHELVAQLGLGGRHWPGDDADPAASAPPAPDGLTSRSCHDLAILRAALGRFDAVFFGPVFPSLSKPGHGLRPETDFAAVSALLAARTPTERRTRVLALGGITAATAPRALALGFDGVAVLGAIWQAADPVRAFAEISSSPARHAA